MVKYVHIDLFAQELWFHEPYTPFVHSSPQVLQAFRRKLQCLRQGDSLADGAPLVLVAEQGGEVVAMAENTLLEVGAGDESGFTPVGRYWCIDNISVRAAFQGQSVGRQLVQAIEDWLAALRLDLDGYVLWYNPDNPKAASFWPRLGFQPLSGLPISDCITRLNREKTPNVNVQIGQDVLHPGRSAHSLLISLMCSCYCVPRHR
jgi:GNAT superfamily N-acetyltransferase